jgi:hypothetical protein
MKMAMTEEQKLAQTATLESWLEAGRGGYTTQQLQEAFKEVANSEGWKRDIDAVITADAGKQNLLEFAIPWHTGGHGVVFEDAGEGLVRVTAPGYWSNGMDG